jgi:alpha-glucosidase
MREPFNWWKHGVFYQIYPRSFMDSDGDGIGDLQGILDRLDYLVELGVDAIWISPIYPSPMADFGYDVSDYTAIHPMFGDMATFDRLLEEAHARDLRVVLDYVPNHTSDQHPWFVESRASRHSPKRDWYIWKDAKLDVSTGQRRPPNNWHSLFGGSAWEWDEKTGQYYLHSFLKEQPDLNWRNPEVVAAMHDVLRFWFAKGVDGFRVDAVLCCVKHPDFPDNPPIDPNSAFAAFGMTQAPLYNTNQPQVHDVIRGFRQVAGSYDGDRVLIGEVGIPDPAEIVKYYGQDLDEFQIPFNFFTMFAPWNAAAIKQGIQAYYALLPQGATPNFVFGNHDFPRPATRVGPQNHRSVGMLLLTLWGIPTMYYGDELGMENVPIPPDRVQDPAALRLPGSEAAGRDPQRTPMQWDPSPNAGFAPQGVEPWLPLAGDYSQVNVAVQHQDLTSTLSFYKALLRLRREMPALHGGDFAFVEGVPEDVIAYTRSAGGERALVVVNFEANAHTLDMSSVGRSAELLLSSQFTRLDRVDLAALPVGPHESLLLRIG